MIICVRYYSPVVGYVPFPEEHLALEQWSPTGRKGHGPSRKGYIVVQSDRDPTKEVRSLNFSVNFVTTFNV